MKVRCDGKTIQAPVTERIAFGVKDERGREYGYRITRFVEEYTPIPEGLWRPCYIREPGVFHVARTHLIREGRGFGATQAPLLARSAEELEKLIAKRVGAARRRIAKRFA